MASGDKRSVSTDALETLGTIFEDGGRDAIHLAVEPVVAGETLRPGQHIGTADGVAWATKQNVKKVGIVDPFLTESVRPHQKFWLVIYPRKITSLRHVWSHPDFPEPAHDRYAGMSTSEKWLREYADSLPVHLDELLMHAEWWVESTKNGGWGDYWCDGGRFEGVRLPEAFWDHYHAYTSKPIDPEKRSFFTCSC